MSTINALEIEDLKYFLAKIEDEKYLRTFNLLIDAFKIKNNLSIDNYFEYVNAVNLHHDSNHNEFEAYREYVLKELTVLVKDPLLDLFEAAFNLNYKNRLKCTRSRDFCTTEMYLREYCTIKLDVGRQTGKSTLGLNLLQQCGAIIIVKNESMKFNLKRMISNACTSYNERNEYVKRIFTLNEIKNERIADFKSMQLNPDLIVVDEVSFIKDTDVELIYKTFGTTKNKTFLFLG